MESVKIDRPPTRRESGRLSGNLAPRSSASQSRKLPEKLLDVLAAASISSLLGLWLAIVVSCGVVYWLLGFGHVPSLREGEQAVPANLEGLGTALYFSFITATSVGYGDVVPVGVARVLTAIESMAALLIFGVLISKLVSYRQEHLVEEIHLLTFEDRLGRVRTNLHMVLAELQALSSECGRQNIAAERLLPRVESATMVFVGELRAVHDLLYRPQRAPEEAALEAILANLAAGLREFGDLLDKSLAPANRSAVFKLGLQAISNLAGEICGECVPREHAPELKTWMDRIHELAGKLAAAGR